MAALEQTDFRDLLVPVSSPHKASVLWVWVPRSVNRVLLLSPALIVRFMIRMEWQWLSVVVTAD